MVAIWGLVGAVILGMGGFGIWLAVGLVFYFLYGFKHSVLRTGKPR